MTENSDLSKVFRDWCEVDMHNFYFFLHWFLVEKDQTKRFLLDQCFIDVHKVRMKDASGHLKTVVNQVVSDLKTSPTYPEKGGFIIYQQDKEVFDQ